MWSVSLPLAVQVSTKSWFPLNMNEYRNAHFRTLNAAKKEFERRVMPLIKNLPTLDRISLAYVLFTPDNRRCDVGNICYIVDKFFSDTLVKAGKLKDDHRKVLPIIAFRDGGIDKNNPRVDVIIHSIGPNADIILSDA